MSTTENTNIPHDGYPETSETVVELSVDGSDIDGHELTYQWQYNGQIISDILADNSFSYQVPGYGSYEFNVEVCDCYDCTVEIVEVFVDEELNEYPIAGAGEDRTIDLSGSWECGEESDCVFNYQDNFIFIDALENSFDPEGDPLTFSWTKVNVPDSLEIEYSENSSMISFKAPNPNDLENLILEFELHVYDSYGEHTADTDNIEITINSLYRETEIEVKEHAMLIGLPSIPYDYEDRALNSVFEDLREYNSYDIIGDGIAATWYEDLDTWIGSLSHVDPRHGYWIKTPRPGCEGQEATEENEEDCGVATGTPGNYDTIGSFTHVGIPTDCSVSYTIKYGANLISFTGQDGMLIDDAFPVSDYPEYYNCDGDKGIIGEGVAATWNPILGWAGSLTNLEKDKGYWFKSCADADFEMNWSCDEISSRSIQAMDHKVERFPEGFEYAQSTQQGFYFIEKAQINSEDISIGDWIIAYNGNVVVGARQWQGQYTDIPFMGYDNTLATSGYAVSGDIPSFKLYQEDTGKLIEMHASEVGGWSNNSLNIISNLSATVDMITPSDIVLNNAYPNPFNPSTRISFAIPSDMHVDLSIYDINGRMVEQLINDVKLAGSYDINWDASMNASGVYFIRFNADGNMHTQKILLVK